MMKLIAAAIAAVIISACASAPADKTAPTSQPESKAAAAAPEKEAAVQAPAKKEPKVVVVRIPLETKASIWFADGSLDETVVSDRDASGLLVAQSRATASGTVVERTEFAYRENKLISKTVKDGEGKLVSRRTYAYAPSGVLIGESSEDGAGKRLSNFEYAYDGAGHRTAWIVKDAGGTVLAETSYAYKDGKIQKAELKDSAGRKTGSSTYEYDGEGRLSKQTFYDAGGSVLRIETTAWKNGKISVEERKTAGGVVQQRSSYEYGNDGELLKKVVEDIVGKSKLTTTYEYAFKEERKTIE
jgi:hypothetical protein